MEVTYVMDSLRNLASAVATGTNDRLHIGRFHSHLACIGGSVPRYPVAEWPPGSLIIN